MPVIDLNGRITLFGLGTSPKRELCRLNNSFTSQAFDDNGVNDDLAWIDNPLLLLVQRIVIGSILDESAR